MQNEKLVKPQKKTTFYLKPLFLKLVMTGGGGMGKCC